MPLLTIALVASGTLAWHGAASAAPTLVPQTISAGGYHTCALDTAGKAWCWGSDGDGQVGDGSASQADKRSPVRVAGDRAYTTIKAGIFHTCALDAAGKAWCWGSDGGGQVGDGSANQDSKYAPVRVAGDRAYTTITAGYEHTCALDTAGKAWCWGYDLDGQVGDGFANQAPKHSPARVVGDRPYITITAGWAHTCALDAAGKARCWGADWDGQVGDGSASQDPKHSPVRVAGDRVYTAISAGVGHTCALDAAGKARCWGADGDGQVGDGSASQADKTSPVRVAGDRAYTAITAGFHTCALDAGGKARCWGYDDSGQVGDGSASQADKFAPVAVRMPMDYDTEARIALATITAGYEHTCALDRAGKAWCWGDDELGQVGDGSASQADKYAPVRVAGNRVYKLAGYFDRS